MSDTLMLDSDATPMDARRLGSIFAKLEAASAEVSALIANGHLAEGFHLEDVESLIAEAIAKAEIVRGANSVLHDEFCEGYEEFADASKSRGVSITQ